MTKLISLLFFYLSFGNALASDPAVPLIWNIPASNDFFVGRQNELAELDNLLNKYHKAIIVGSGGIGKTQLAKQYVHTNHHNYRIVWWFDMSKNIDDQLISFANQLNNISTVNAKIDFTKTSANAVLLYIKELLRTTDKSWLLIFDNVKNTNLIKDYFPETHNRSNKDILVTTRNTNEVLPCLYLKNFTLNESLEFLAKLVSTEDIDDLNKLSKLLAFYPLALAQAAAYIKTNNVKIDEYITLYNKDLPSLWKNEKTLLSAENDYFDLNKRTIETTISLNFTNIKDESLLASEIIELISLIKVALIPEYLLKDCIKTSKSITEEDYNAALRTLKKHSLIDEQEKEGKKYYRTHDLVKTIIKHHLTGGIKQSFFPFVNRHITNNTFEANYRKILMVLCNYLDKPWGEMVTYINANTELMNIANNIAFRAYKDKIKDPLLAELMISLLEHNNMIFHMKSNYKTYQELAEAVHDLIDKQKVQLPLILQVRYYFNGIYADFIYKSKEATKKYEKKLIELLALFEKTSYSKETKFLAFINMAEFYLLKGNITQGLYYIDKAYTLLPIIANLNYQAQFWYAITWLHLEKGDYKQANEYISTFFKTTENNKNYPIHLYAMNMRASINFHLNNLEEAFFFANECYKQALIFFQSEVSNIGAESLITLARYYKANNDYKNAEKKIKSAIEALNIVFGSHNIDPSQAVSHTLLGEIYMEQKLFKEAYDEYNFAEKYYTKLYKNKFSDIQEVSKLFANFIILGIKIHDNNMVKQYFKKLIAHFTIQNQTTRAVIEILDKEQIDILE
jgi:Tfp pilus assembly protein PilF